MNRDKTNEIIDFYIDKFDKTAGKEHDELYKWRSAWQCRQNWNPDADDFCTMFQSCFKDSTPLISSSFWWPDNGIVMLCDARNNHQEAVRDAFRTLTQDTGDDLSLRGKNVFAFISRINSLLEGRSSGKGYLQNVRSALSYLGLIDPRKDFIYKPTAAGNFADSVEFAENFSSGQAFRLDLYYKMCGELIDIVRTRPDLLEVVQRELQRQAETCNMPGLAEIDPDFHILAYDIMYTADAYDYYMDHPFVHRTKASRTKQEKEEQKQEIENEISYIKDQISLLTEKLAKMKEDDLQGISVNHKKFGEGRIIRRDGDKVTVDFPAGKKVLSLSFLTANGILGDEALASAHRERMDITAKLATYKANLAIKNSELHYFIQKNKSRKQLQEEEEERERQTLSALKKNK
ncbi:MAG: hypothetical protein ACI4ET_07735 [Bilifractor sp.]